MKTAIESYNKEQFEIELYFSNEFKGRGGWNILCQVDFNNERRTFRTYTTSSQFIDTLSDMKADDKSYDEIQELYFSTYFDELREIILEWCQEVTENVANEDDE